MHVLWLNDGEQKEKQLKRFAICTQWKDVWVPTNCRDKRFIVFDKKRSYKGLFERKMSWWHSLWKLDFLARSQWIN